MKPTERIALLTRQQTLLEDLMDYCCNAETVNRNVVEKYVIEYKALIEVLEETE